MQTYNLCNYIGTILIYNIDCKIVSSVIIYDRRAFLRLATGGISQVHLLQICQSVKGNSHYAGSNIIIFSNSQNHNFKRNKDFEASVPAKVKWLNHFQVFSRLLLLLLFLLMMMSLL